MNTQQAAHKLTDDQLDDVTFGPGLYAIYSRNYTAYADSDRDLSKPYAIRYCHEAMPPHKTSRFATTEELTAAMLETASLDKWLTIELDDDDGVVADEE